MWTRCYGYPHHYVFSTSFYEPTRETACHSFKNLQANNFMTLLQKCEFIGGVTVIHWVTLRYTWCHVGGVVWGYYKGALQWCEVIVRVHSHGTQWDTIRIARSGVVFFILNHTQIKIIHSLKLSVFLDCTPNLLDGAFCHVARRVAKSGEWPLPQEIAAPLSPY